MLARVVLGASVAAVAMAAGASSSTTAPVQQQVHTKVFRLPLYFIENQGQADARVRYYLQGRGTAVYFTPQAVVVALSERAPREEAGLRLVKHEPAEARRRWALRLEFVGARAGVRPEGLERTQAVVSYFKGPREAWHTGLPTYAGVRYRDLWPGIDLVWSGEEGRLKSSFIVKPGADPGRIRLRWRGASKVRVGPEGELEVTTPVGNFAEQRPVAYQEAGGGKLEVAAGYWLRGREYGFRLGEYDRSRELVVDPVILLYAGYIGGSAEDHAYAIAVDAAGNAYVAGETKSSEATFPVTVGPDLSYNGAADAFVVKVNASGTALVYASYIGGSGEDCASGIAVDAAGNAYVTGYTNSSETSFPVSVGPDLTFNGSWDAFVVKVNGAGTGLVYAGYIGGSGDDRAYGIAVDVAGNAYVVGTTGSTEATFPVTVGPDLSYNGGSDAFVAKVNSSGTGLVYAGYIGGSGDDSGRGIAVDAAGNAYVTGYTDSTQTTSPVAFPVLLGPDLTHNGLWDAFVAKVNASGTALLYAGYIGGSDVDVGRGIAVDAAGNAYVVGHTASRNFPVTVGPDLTYNGGDYDAFVAKVNPSGTALVYAGYIGGGQADIGRGIAVDAAGNAYVTGNTNYWGNFPVKLGPSLTHSGGEDAFIVKVNAAGTAWIYAGFIGGVTTDIGEAVAVDAMGNAYVAGCTSSAESSFPVKVGPDLIYHGNTDAFVAKVSSAAPTAAFRDTNTSIRLLTRYDSPQLYYGAGLFASDPAAAQTAQGDTVVVARDNWGSLWANVFTASTQTWGTWAFGAGITKGVPAVAVAGDGKAYIAARDNWNSYWLVSYTPGGSFGGWEYLAGIFSTDPVMAACPDGSLYIIGKDNWNSLWSGRYVPGTGFGGWQWGQGIVQGKPSVACGSDNVAYVAVRDNLGSLWLPRVQGNSWLGWINGDGAMSRDPQAVAAGDGIVYVVLRDPWGVVWYRGYREGSSGGWLPWVMTGGVLQDFAAAGELGEVYIAGRSPSNELWWYRLVTNQWTYAGYGGVAAGPLAAAPR